jgi:hypothetical protein
MGRGQNINMDDFEGFKTSMVEVTADAVETAEEPELEVGPEDVTEFWNLMIKTLMNEELLLMDKQRNGFLRWNLLLVKTL